MGITLTSLINGYLDLRHSIAAVGSHDERRREEGPLDVGVQPKDLSRLEEQLAALPRHVPSTGPWETPPTLAKAAHPIQAEDDLEYLFCEKRPKTERRREPLGKQDPNCFSLNKTVDKLSTDEVAVALLSRFAN